MCDAGKDFGIMKRWQFNFRCKMGRVIDDWSFFPVHAYPDANENARGTAWIDSCVNGFVVQRASKTAFSNEMKRWDFYFRSNTSAPIVFIFRGLLVWGLVPTNLDGARIICHKCYLWLAKSGKIALFTDVGHNLKQLQATWPRIAFGNYTHGPI